MKGWLDQYQKGGIVDKYLPTDRFLQPNSEKLPIGYRIPTNIPSSELASSIGGEGGEPAYLIPTFKYGQSLSNPLQEYKNTGEHLGGPFKTWQEAEEFEKIRHSYVEKNQPIPFPLKTRSYQNGGELKYYQNGTDFKPKSIGQFGKTVSHEYIDKLKEFENTTKNFGYHVDSRKIPTIGYGHRLTDKEKKEKIIYIGEEKVPFDKFKGAEGQMYADRLLQEQDIPSHYDKMIKLYGDKYSQPVKDVLFDIVYQQGNAKNSAKFLKGSYPNIKEWQDYLTSAANESSGGDKTRMQWRANALSKDPSNWFLGNMLPYAQPAVRDMTNLPTYKYGGEISSAQSGKLIPTDTKKNIHTGKPVISPREEWEKQQQKSELAEWIKKQNQYQREHSDIYTDPQTGKQVVQNIGIEPTVSPIDAAALGVGALYSGGIGLLGSMAEFANPLPINPFKIGKSLKNFKSEIDWTKWNKEIPENKTLLQKYNAIDYKKNPLSDKEKEMYQWFYEQMRFDKLPQTTNKQSIEVLDNFKQRIRTPEGQKRLKELGITEEQLLQDLKIVEDPNTYGYYRGAKNTIAINPNHPLPKKVVRHEIEHGVQNALRQSKINKVIDGTPAEKLKALESTTTEIDDILSGLTLRREGTPDKKWIGKAVFDKPVQIDEYKDLINNKQNATDYFLTGSDGAEKSAFLGEVQQYMMDTGKIPKDSYVQITPEMVKETMIDAMFDEAGGGKYLRLFNIIKADPKNYELISKGLNKMLTVSPLIGAGAYMQNKEYKNGGVIGNNGMFDMTNPNIYKSLLPIGIGTGAYQANKSSYASGGNIIKDNNGYWNPDNWGKPVKINTNRITMKGVDVPLLGISDAQDVQLMQPNGEYLFKGTSVVELPIASKGKTINGWMDKYNK